MDQREEMGLALLGALEDRLDDIMAGGAIHMASDTWWVIRAGLRVKMDAILFVTRGLNRTLFGVPVVIRVDYAFGEVGW